VKHQAALKFFSMRLSQLQEDPGQLFFSCDLPKTCLRTLLSMLAPSSYQTADDAFAGSAGHLSLGGLLENAQVKSHVWFTVVSHSPASSKRAVRGELVASDVGIALHSCHGRAEHGGLRVLVSSTPTNVEAAHGMETGVSAIVLAARSLSTEELLTARCWRVQDVPLVMMLAGADASQRALASNLLTNMLSHGDAGLRLATLPDEVKETAVELLRAWEQDGIIEKAPAGEEDRWTLTAQGSPSVQGCVTLGCPRAVLAVRALPPEELSVFELISKLELDGWSCSFAADKQAIKEARKTPYQSGQGVKRWWIAGLLDQLPKIYLQLLLTAHDHGKAVKHLASVATYKNCWIQAGPRSQG